jgi:HNH endonuclease
MATRRSAARGRDHRATRRLAARLKRQGDPCWLCGHAIDPALKSPHPQSFSMDHIIPVSMGGDPADPYNVRSAHRLCNMKRGTGRGHPRSDGDRSSRW